MIRRPPRSTPLYSSAASDVYKRQGLETTRTLFSAVNPPSVASSTDPRVLLFSQRYPQLPQISHCRRYSSLSGRVGWPWPCSSQTNSSKLGNEPKTTHGIPT